MAGLLSREGEALKKALSREKKVELTQKIDQLESAIKQIEAMNASRAAEAERILSVERNVDGSEIWPQGNLFRSLTIGLDESGLRSAITIIASVLSDVKSKEAEWIEEQRVEHERTAPHLKFRPDYTHF